LFDDREEALAEELEDAPDRFNDVIADPLGRVYAGTFSDDPKRGGLFLVDTDGAVQCLFRGTGCSNGMGFSPDRKTFYWTCSTSRQIFRFNYKEATGELTDREVVVRLGDDDEGTVDGMTVDVEGNLWSAIWDGFAVRKYSPEGDLLGTVRFPVAKPSSAIFGGPDLDRLYVTTAGGAADADTAEGTLYRVDVGAKGLPEFRSRVRLG
jgi:D-xylonolactonase